MRHEGVPRLFSRQAMGVQENHSTSENGSSKSGQTHVQYGEFVEDSKTTFTEQKGCFLSFWRIGLLTVCVIGALLLVGLLVGYLAPCDRNAIQLTQISAQRRTSTSNRQGRMFSDESNAQSSVSAPESRSRRLPLTLEPVHYKLVIQPHLPPDNFTFDGYVEIKFRCREETKDIVLHAYELYIRSLNVTKHGSEYISVSDTYSDEDSQMFTVNLEENLMPNEIYRISIEYRGEINSQSIGLYRTSYKDETGEQRWIATSQLQPTDARRLLPCFDEPALKATFEVSVIRRNDDVSLSNMPVWKTEPWDEEWQVDLYNTTVPMSTYLLAFVIGRVAPYKKDDSSQFQVWGRPETVHQGEYAYNIGPKLLEFYEEIFGVDYPLPKTDMVAVPEIPFAAMENWGLIIFEEFALFFDPKRSSSEDLIFVTVVIAHELAHQWFGNLVTAAWWDDLWLHEGFATYVEYIGAAAVQPDWGMDQMFLLDVYEVLLTDSLLSSHAISAAVAAEPDQIMELFDEVSYLKGGTIIRMMEHFLGYENFRKGLRAYLQAHSYSTATREDLWKCLNETTEEIDVRSVMDAWTMQNGYPVVTVNRQYETKSASIRQEAFIFESDEGKGPIEEQKSKKLWTIPLTYTSGDNPEWTTKTRHWFSEREGNITDLNNSDTWLLFNVQQVGYYRVNYDKRNWDLLIQQLVTDHQEIHVINRGQIINDALNLARDGHISYPLALNLTVYLLQEKDFLPWKGALLAFKYIDLMLAKTEAYGTWRDFVLLLMTPVYNSLGWSPTSEEETMLSRLLRTEILKWTCNYGGDDCLETAVKKFKQWKLSSPEQQIVSPDVLEVVLCTGLAHGNSKDWDFVWKRYVDETLMTERNRLLKSLACTREPWLLRRLLQWLLKPDSGIKQQDAGEVFEAVAQNEYGRDLVFNFFKSSREDIFNTYGSMLSEMSKIVEHSTSAITSVFELEEMRSFLNRRSSTHLGTGSSAFQMSVERVATNVRWMRENFDVVREWLENQMAAIGAT